MKLHRIRSLFAILALVVGSLPFAPTVMASGGAPGAVSQPCTAGDAAKLFEELIVFFDGTSPPPCQYRLFFNKQTFTFCQDDYILGGIVWYSRYIADGISREAAIADLELQTDRVWLDGVEQVLQETGYKDAQHPNYGQIVYQQHGFIKQLAPGDHVSVWVGSYPGAKDEKATVKLHILPRSQCT